MIRNVYALRDVLTGFLTPVFQDNDEIAKRSFYSSCNQDAFNDLTANPEDFALYKIGSYNTETGVLTPCDPECLGYGKRG